MDSESSSSGIISEVVESLHLLNSEGDRHAETIHRQLPHASHSSSSGSVVSETRVPRTMDQVHLPDQVGIPDMEEEEEEYEVEQIIDWKIVEAEPKKRKTQRAVWYQVKWQGYEDHTWEPQENLEHCEDTLENFLNTLSTESRRKHDIVIGKLLPGESKIRKTKAPSESPTKTPLPFNPDIFESGVETSKKAERYSSAGASGSSFLKRHSDSSRKHWKFEKSDKKHGTLPPPKKRHLEGKTWKHDEYTIKKRKTLASVDSQRKTNTSAASAVTSDLSKKKQVAEGTSKTSAVAVGQGGKPEIYAEKKDQAKRNYPEYGRLAGEKVASIKKNTSDVDKSAQGSGKKLVSDSAKSLDLVDSSCKDDKLGRDGVQLHQVEDEVMGERSAVWPPENADEVPDLESEERKMDEEEERVSSPDAENVSLSAQPTTSSRGSNSSSSPAEILDQNEEESGLRLENQQSPGASTSEQGEETLSVGGETDKPKNAPRKNVPRQELHSVLEQLKDYFDGEIKNLAEEEKEDALMKPELIRYPLPVNDIPLEMIGEFTTYYEKGNAKIKELEDDLEWVANNQKVKDYSKRVSAAAKLGNKELFMELMDEWGRVEEDKENDNTKSQEQRKKEFLQNCLTKITNESTGVTLMMDLCWQRGEWPCEDSGHCYCSLLSHIASNSTTEYKNAVTVNNKWSALMVGCKCGSRCLVKELLNCGCFVSLKDCEGQSALHIAAARGDLEIVRWLVLNGADMALEDVHGMSPKALSLPFMYDHSVYTWLSVRQRAVNELMKSWITNFCQLDKFISGVSPLTSAHVFPAHEQQAGEVYSLMFQISGLESEKESKKPLLFMFLAKYGDQERERAAESPHLIRKRKEEGFELEMIKCNGFHEQTLNKKQTGSADEVESEDLFGCWVSSLRGVKSGYNEIRIMVSAPPCTKSQTLMFIQPWLCRLNSKRVDRTEKELTIQVNIE